MSDINDTDKTAKKEIKKLKKKLRVQEKKNTEIRDHMAMERANFANERTLMAYLRTAITVFAGGFAAVKFANDTYLIVLGFALLPIGVMIAIFGFYRFRKKQQMLHHHTQHYAPTSHEHAKVASKEDAGPDFVD